MSVSTRVYMGGISYRTREKDIERFFRKYGRIREISIKNGYAFVDFDDRRDADDAVYDLHGVDFMGERVSVEFAKGTPHGRDRERYGYGRSRSRSRSRGGGRGGGGGDGGDRRPVWLDKYGPPTRTDYRVVVENLSSRVSWQDLKDFMRGAGEVTYADAHKQARNEGVVEFASYDDMRHAIDKLDDSELNGRRIKMVSQYKGSKRTRSRSRSRSRKKSRAGSRSGSRSRSRSRKSRSRSRSRSRKDKKSRSRSRKSRSRSRKSRSRSRSRKSRSGSKKTKSERRGSRSSSRGARKSRSKSKSEGAKSKSRERERSRSRSGSERRRSRSKSNKSDKD